MALHENPYVESALNHLAAALSDLNMADTPYAIGVTGVDEPYGMVERALIRTLHHAFPDLNPRDVYDMRIDCGESLNYCVSYLRTEREREREEQEEAIAPFRQYLRSAPNPDVVMRFELPGDRLVSVIPDSYDRDSREAKIRDGRFEVAVGTLRDRSGGLDSVDWDRYTGVRISGLFALADILTDVMDGGGHR